jgi:hypothetical protein
MFLNLALVCVYPLINPIGGPQRDGMERIFTIIPGIDQRDFERAANDGVPIAEYVNYTEESRRISSALTDALHDEDVESCVFGSRGAKLYVRMIDQAKAVEIVRRVVREQRLKVRVIEEGEDPNPPHYVQ